MIATLVFVDVKPEYIDAFNKITNYNHKNSRLEEGNIRFDVLQSNQDETKFILYEVFEDDKSAAAHKTTKHYLKWREEVEPYMATPRRAIPTTPVSFG